MELSSDVTSHGRIRLHDAVHPADVVGKARVDAELAPLAAALAEAGDAEDGPAAAGIPAEQRTPRVPRARVHATPAVAGAEHVAGYAVVLVHSAALFVRHYRHLKPDQGEEEDKLVSGCKQLDR